MPACPRCSRENPSGAHFCNACGAELAVPSAREVRKTVTVVFSDVTGSTSLGERLDPESMRRIMRRYFEVTREALEGHGGSVEKFIGDAVMAIFGIPVLHEDDALRAVRAAAEMRERLSVLNDELERDYGVRIETRTGVNTGEVVAGEGETLATGDAVNVAARLEQTAAPGEILLGGATYRLVRDAVRVDLLPSLTLKGKAEAVEAYQLAEVLPEVVSRRLESPMVGRERERRRLHDAFDQAASDRSCQLFTVLGPAGVGKSRLVREFLHDLAGRAEVARGRCLPYGEGITYWPLLEAVKDAVGLDDADSPEEARAKLTRAFGDDEGAELAALRLAEMIGLGDAGGVAEEQFQAARALIEARARAQPQVVVFDDIHWGEATFLDLVEHLADWTRDAPVLLVCLARPELLDVRPGWGGGKLNATSVLLESLSDEESTQLLDNLAGLAGVGGPTRRRIVEAAEGNPLFVEEMFALATEDGHSAGELVVPPTIQALLAARLDRLPADERGVIERAAVGGKVFYEDAVFELSPEEARPTVTSSLGSLRLKEMIRPDRPSLGGRTYRFRHLLIRDAAYESTPKEARSQLHERFGRWLESAAGERMTEYEEVVGYHLEQAHGYRAELGPADDAARGLAREAAERLGRAGRRAFMRSDAPAGVNLISRAVGLLPPDDSLRVELVPNVRVVQGMGADMSWAERVLTEAIEAAATTGDRRFAAHALVQRAFLRLFTSVDVMPRELLDVADRAVAVFEELGDDLGLARSWRLAGQAHYLDRHLGLCVEASERALSYARRTRDRFEEREIVEWLVIALFLGPAPADQAARRCQELLEERAGGVGNEAHILAGLAVLVAMQGHLGEAEKLMTQGKRSMEELGESVWLLSFHYSYVAMWQDDPVTAEHELRPAYEALKRTGEKSHFSSMAHGLAHAVYTQGRYDEAEQLTRECEEACRPNDVHSHVMWRATRAKVLARKGELTAADRLAREAVSLAETSDFLLAHADALMDLGEVLELGGDRKGAAAAVQEAIGFYELKGNLLAAHRAHGRLETLDAC